MPSECAIDTTILQKANALLTVKPRQASLFVRRVRLLRRIQKGELTVLISKQLQAEYQRQIQQPRNEFVRAFFELIGNSDRCIWNWQKEWSGSHRQKARGCRYPKHDDHVLRTAIRPTPSAIYTEETPMLATDACIYREFGVHILPLP